jgi:hypothetical protein
VEVKKSVPDRGTRGAATVFIILLKFLKFPTGFIMSSSLCHLSNSSRGRFYVLSRRTENGFDKMKKDGVHTLHPLSRDTAESDRPSTTAIKLE